MLELIPFEEGNVIGFRLNGRIEDDEFDEAVGLIEKKLKEYKKLRVYAEIEKVGGMSVNTFMKDIHFKLRHWMDFEREAVVSDKRWIETWVRFASRFFPHIKVKHFSFEEAEEAKEWIRG